MVSAAEVVEGDVSLHDVSRSNSVYLVSAAGRSFVAKACLDDGRPPGQGDAALERAFYRHVGATAGVRAPLPPVLLVADDLLAMAPVGRGETLEARIRITGPSSGAGCLLGTALGTWRSVAAGLDWDGCDLPRTDPWVFSVLADDAPPFLAHYPALSEMAQAVAADADVADGLAASRSQLRHAAVVHGDFRWDNALLVHDPGTGRERIILIDWEFAHWGDPAWDVAGAVADAFASAVLPMLAVDGPPDPSQLHRLCSSLDWFFWSFGRAYLDAAADHAPVDDLTAAAALVPARLVQTAFQLVAHDYEDGPTSGRGLLGLASSLARQPELLVRWLCGLPVAALAGVGAGAGTAGPP